MKNLKAAILLSSLAASFLSSCSIEVKIMDYSGITIPSIETRFEEEFGVFGVQDSPADGYIFTASIGSEIVTPVVVDGYSFQPLWMAQ
jgi:hypothetical protein